MSHNLNSIKLGYIREYIGKYYGVVFKGDTRSLAWLIWGFPWQFGRG